MLINNNVFDFDSFIINFDYYKYRGKRFKLRISDFNMEWERRTKPELFLNRRKFPDVWWIMRKNNYYYSWFGS